ncbi:MAG: Trk system potassium transporter TrkA [Muribaculaceae bacterium]|nr:Trk system potassium transporter TrkA [Muribaculaceae bacterium]
MNIIIAGAGDVGTHLAKLLAFEEQDILVIDEDAEKLQFLDANYNLMTLEGSPTSFHTMREARMHACDLFIAVTPSENDNVVACAMARNIGAKVTVARISTFDYMADENRVLLQKMGVDHVIYPEYLAAQEIIVALRRSWVRHWFELHDGAIIVVGVKLHEGASIIGMKLREFAPLNPNFHVSAIKRGHDIIIPGGNDELLEDDILYFTCTREHVDELLELTGKTLHHIKRVMVMGGGKIAIRLASMVNDEFKIKIIESDLKTCQALSEKCPHCEIVHGDARDIDLLVEEGIEQMDAFISLSGNSEANILTCLTAKELGVRKTVAEVENIQYISQAEGLNIGTIINKKLLASSSIFQLLLDTDSSSPKCLALTDAEVAELVVKPKAKICNTPVKDLRLSHDLTLAGFVRDGKGMLVRGDTVFQPGDSVVVFSKMGSLNRIEKLFK